MIVKRNGLAGTFLLIGAFISMITRISNLTLSQYQGFGMDKSLIKKMYSYKPPKSKKRKAGYDDDNENLDEN